MRLNRKGNMVIGGLFLLLSVACVIGFFLLPPYLTFAQKVLVLGIAFMFMIAGMGEIMRDS